MRDRLSAVEMSRSGAMVVARRRWSRRWYSSALAAFVPRKFESCRDIVTLPLSLADWVTDFDLELHRGADWNSYGRAGRNTPGGGHYRFVKSGSAM